MTKQELNEAMKTIGYAEFFSDMYKYMQLGYIVGSQPDDDAGWSKFTEIAQELWAKYCGASAEYPEMETLASDAIMAITDEAGRIASKKIESSQTNSAVANQHIV